jgi:hypothetical protein
MDLIITPEEFRRFENDWAEIKNPDRQKHHWKNLEKKLLSLGGSGVLLHPTEPYAVQLVERGKEFKQGIRLLPGELHFCHSNVAELWSRDIFKAQIVTGYAIGRTNNKWIEHSWILNGKSIIETTLPFDRYFGVSLGLAESIRFWSENVLGYLDKKTLTESFWIDRPGVLDLLRELATAMGLKPETQSLSNDFAVNQVEQETKGGVEATINAL